MNQFELLATALLLTIPLTQAGAAIHTGEHDIEIDCKSKEVTVSVRSRSRTPEQTRYHRVDVKFTNEPTWYLNGRANDWLGESVVAIEVDEYKELRSFSLMLTEKLSTARGFMSFAIPATSRKGVLTYFANPLTDETISAKPPTPVTGAYSDLDCVFKRVELTETKVLVD